MVAPHARARIHGMLLVALAAACTDPTTSASRPIRLIELEGELATGASATTDVFTEDFAEGLSAWRPVGDPVTLAVDPPAADPTAADPSAAGLTASARLQREAGRSFLALEGGALCRVVPVEPGTTYEFSGEIRAGGVEPSTKPASGAMFWIAEVDRVGSPEEVFREGYWVNAGHRLPAGDAQGWQRRRVVLRTADEARALVVVAISALDGRRAGGEVDFADLALRRVDDSVHWEHLAAREIAHAARGETELAGWQARRRVSNVLAADARPSILCLPGETLTLRLDVPRGAPRLEVGLGPWSEETAGGASAALEFRARIDGRDVLRESFEPTGEPNRTSWRDVEVDLGPWAGRSVALELGVAGARPGVFGAPLVRDASARADAPNVLLVSIDTLRADHVGAYGCERGLTPAIDALAAGGILFEDVVAQAPYTLPAHASLFTGQFPTVHAVERGGSILSSLRSPILAEVLAERGLRTQAFTGGGFLVPAYGFHKGFDGFSTVDPFRHRASRYFDSRRKLLGEEHAGAEREPGLAPVREWLAAHAGAPFFLFLHTYEVHDYDPPPDVLDCAQHGCRSSGVDVRDWAITNAGGWKPRPITDSDRAHVGHLYDAALRHVDGVVGTLLGDLERLGIADRTVVALTSDHGEEMFERGFLQHGKTVYEEQTRIPMILRVPGVAPRRSAVPCMQVDLAPMLLGALELPLDPRMQGVDLLRRDPGRRPLWTEVDDAFVHKLALATPDGWKLVHAPPDADVRYPSADEWELFHLPADPLERRDLAREDDPQFARLRAELEAYRAHLETLRDTLGAVATGGELDDETLRQLAELGYVDAGG